MHANYIQQRVLYIYIYIYINNATEGAIILFVLELRGNEFVIEFICSTITDTQPHIYSNLYALCIQYRYCETCGLHAMVKHILITAEGHGHTH